MTPLSRKASVLLVALLLATTAVSAAPPRTRPALIPMDPLAQLWSFLTSLWTENGCQVDPSGQCLPGTVTSKNGCSVDPDGRCLPGTSSTTVTPKNGCQVDPDGRCLTGSTATVTKDNGCSADPDGYCVQ